MDEWTKGKDQALLSMYETLEMQHDFVSSKQNWRRYPNHQLADSK